jgi:hypothetical protein
VPALIDIVETEIGWPQTHAILLLCELRAETALPALQDVLSGSNSFRNWGGQNPKLLFLQWARAI